MKAGTVFFAAAIVVSALAATVWVGKYRPAKSETAPPPKQFNPNEDAPPEDPEAKLEVVDGTSFDFGTMEVNATRQHKFVIKNVGKVPLKLKQGNTTCKCTLSELAGDSVPPGEEVAVELKWEGKGESEEFRQTADIWTNVPEHRPLKLEIVGKVKRVSVMTPPGEWDLRTILDETPTKFEGRIYSAVLDEFTISEITAEPSELTAEVVPMTDEELESTQAKCGYRILVSLDPGVPVGAFRGKLQFHTDIRDNDVLSVDVVGYRPGPLNILALGGTQWIGQSNAIQFGQVDAAAGAKAELQVFISGLADDQEFEFLDPQADPDYLRFSLVRDESFKSPTKRRYLLTFEIPPGSPSQARTRSNPGKIVFKTTHPQIPELVFRFLFISTDSN